jgi:oligoendopeptidase F
MLVVQCEKLDEKEWSAAMEFFISPTFYYTYSACLVIFFFILFTTILRQYKKAYKDSNTVTEKLKHIEKNNSMLNRVQ